MSPKRDICPCCNKAIYLHQYVIVCNLEDRVYHASCLGINNSTSVDLALSKEHDHWCFNCLLDIFPFFNDLSTTSDWVQQSCKFCTKFISPINDTRGTCSSCQGICHSRCMNYGMSVCLLCESEPDLSTCPDSRVFNPYSDLLSRGDTCEADDDTIDYISIVDNILSSCSYLNVNPSVNSTDKSISVCFLNIDGVKSNFNEFEASLASVTRSDIFLLAETNTRFDSNLYTLEGYNHTFLHNKTNKVKGAGLALYSRANINVNISIKHDCTSFQALGGNISGQDGKSECTIIAFYRYHDRDFDFDIFLSDLTDFLSSHKLNDNTIICGDFNLNLFNLNTCTRVKRYFEIFTSNGFHPNISRSTNFIGSSSTLIDQIWCNNPAFVTSSNVLNTNVSSHKAIVCDLAHDTPTSVNSERTIRYHDFSSDRVEKFINDYDPPKPGSSVDSVFQTYFDNLINNYESNFLVVKKVSSSRNPVDHPWITSGIKKSCNVKRRLYQRWMSARGKSNEEYYRLGYVEYRKILRKALTTAKNQFYLDKLNRNIRNSRFCWGIINNIAGKSRVKAPIQSLSINGQIITDRRALANGFNEYFSSLPSKLNNNKYGDRFGDVVNSKRFLEFCKYDSPQSLFMDPVCPGEIGDIISSLNPNKSSEISPRILKLLKPIFSTDLSYLYNLCFSQGIFPTCLKRAKVHPLHKKGPKSDIANYRPISILPVLSKVLEKCIHRRLYTFVSNKLYVHQYGFRKHHSTSHALNTAISSTISALDNRKHTAALFLDLSKAFDTINHSILLSKLNRLGVRGVPLQLLESYLAGREQIVQLGDVGSSVRKISTGVPQGSVLGPLLFIIYINDIVNCCEVKDVLFILFADDTNVFVTADTTVELQHKLRCVLTALENYFFVNILHLNITKTKVVYFRGTRTAPPNHHELVISGCKIESVSQITFLGITITDTLSWEPQISRLTLLINSRVGVLRRLFQFVPQCYRKPIYAAFIQSHLMYCISTWGSGGHCHKLLSVFRAQKAAIRAIFGVKSNNRETGWAGANTKPIFNAAGLLTIHNLYSLSIINEVQKSIIYNTGSHLITISSLSGRAIVPPGRIKTLNSNFVFSAPKLWNLCQKDDEIKMNIGLPGFRNKVKRWLMDTQSTGEPNDWVNTNFIDI